jgi:hypothetical protein
MLGVWMFDLAQQDGREGIGTHTPVESLVGWGALVPIGTGYRSLKFNRD